MVNSCGNVGMVSFLTTPFLGKPSRDSLPVFSTHYLTSNLQLALRESAEEKKHFQRKNGTRVESSGPLAYEAGTLPTCRATGRLSHVIQYVHSEGSG